MPRVDVQGKNLSEDVSFLQKISTLFPLLTLFYPKSVIENIRDAVCQCWEDGITSIPRIEDHLFGANSPLDDESKKVMRDLGVIKKVERHDAKGDRV